MVNSVLPKGEGPLPTRVRASWRNSAEAAWAMASASCWASASWAALSASCMAGSLTGEVDFSPQRLVSDLCTKIPPSFETPAPGAQVRAAVLSEDGRLTRYFAERPGNPYRRQPVR